MGQGLAAGHGGRMIPEPLKQHRRAARRHQRARHGGRMIPASLKHERHKQAVSSLSETAEVTAAPAEVTATPAAAATWRA